MIGLLVVIAGAIIAGSIAKKRKRRTVSKRTVSARNSKPGIAPQLDMERERQKICRDYNRRIKAELEHRQAADDITHLEQRKADLLKAYEQIPEADTERNIRRRIAYDNAIRNTDKQIEKAYMTLHRTY
jgi:hypothetical protein